MTVIKIGTGWNPAAKQYKHIERYRVTSSRPHGRPRNVGRITKIRRLADER